MPSTEITPTFPLDTMLNRENIDPDTPLFPFVTEANPIALKIEDSRRYYAVLSNELLRLSRFQIGSGAGNSMTLLELKLLMYSISLIKPNSQTSVMKFEIATFCEIIGMDANEGSNYKQIKNALNKLLTRGQWLSTADYETYVRWLDSLTIAKGSGTVYLLHSASVACYLYGLRRNYTKLSFYRICRMKSKYGILLYLILKAFSFNGRKITFAVKDLRERLDCTNKSYDNFYNFKTKVIDIALRDINHYSELEVTVSYLKKGKEHTHIVFEVLDLEKHSLRCAKNNTQQELIDYCNSKLLCRNNNIYSEFEEQQQKKLLSEAFSENNMLTID